MSKPLLRNDTALVTGAARGIGQAIARAIEEEGGKVLAVDRKDFDLSLPGSALALAETAIRKLKQVSIFVHAASPPRNEAQTGFLIAGSALAHRATLVTRNVREFARVPGLEIVNWYD